MYYPSMFVAGNTSALVRTTITAITEGDMPLTLCSDDIITMDTMAKKVVPGDLRMSDVPASLDDSNAFDTESVDPLVPVFTCLRNYKLHCGGVGRHCDTVTRLSEEFTAARQVKSAECMRNTTKDGCCFIDAMCTAGRKRA